MIVYSDKMVWVGMKKFKRYLGYRMGRKVGEGKIGEDTPYLHPWLSNKEAC